MEVSRRQRNSSRNQTTLYYTSLKSGSDLSSDLFQEGENLILLDSISYGSASITNPLVIGSSSISQNETFATAVSVEANIKGSAANIQEGVYFLRVNEFSKKFLIID